MPKFAANLSFFYQDMPLVERLPAAAKAGFKGVEYMFPYDETPETLKKVLADNGLSQVLINAPAGDWAKGERGLGVVPGRDDEFKAAVDKALTYAAALSCPQVNILAGIAPAGEAVEKTIDRLVERLSYAAGIFAKQNVAVLLEHINNFDMPGYFVGNANLGLEVVKRVNKPNVKLQYDVYHAQRTSGELIAFLRANLAAISHIQIADNPGRNQPGTGEINYPFVLSEIDKAGYKGWIGLEYKPTPDTNGSLGWISQMGYSL